VRVVNIKFSRHFGGKHIKHSSVETMDSELDARWGFMRPWCAPVRGRLALVVAESNSVPPSRAIGLSVALCKTSSEPVGAARFRSIRETLVLLALLARINRQVWRHVLVHYCELDEETDLEQFVEARFVLSVVEPWYGAKHLPAMIPTFFAKLDNAPDPAFAVVVDSIVTLGIHVCGHSRSALERVDILIAVGIEPSHNGASEFVQSVWRGLKALHSQYGGWRWPVRVSAVEGDTSLASSSITTPAGGNNGIECAFKLGPISLEMIGDRLTTDQTRQMAEVVTTGDSQVLSILGVIVAMKSTDLTRNAQFLGRMLEQVLCASGINDENLAMTEEIRLHCGCSSFVEITRLCTALAEARTTASASLFIEQFQALSVLRPWMWKRLAYAFFSERARSRSSITAASLFGVVMTKADAGAIASALAEEDLAMRLFGHIESGHEDYIVSENTPESITRDSPGCRYMLTRGTSMILDKVHPMEPITASTEKWELETDVTGVQILGDDEGSLLVRVLVPGYGVCKVPQTEVLPDENEYSRASGKGGVRSLRLAFNHSRRMDSAEGLPLFLETIGGSLTSLRLGMNDSAVEFYDALRSCPNLKSLVVSQCSFGTAQFLDMYRNSSLEIVELDCSFDDFPLLAAELCDSQTRLAQHLKRLGSKFLGSRWEGQQIDQLDAIVSILQRNHTIEYVYLAVPNIAYRMAMSFVEGFDNQMLPVAREPFPLKCRLAFLSVFASTSERGDREAKRARLEPLSPSSPVAQSSASMLSTLSMNRNVASIIFGFAAERAIRRIRVEPDVIPKRSNWMFG
jgi:hypothetical protein